MANLRFNESFEPPIDLSRDSLFTDSYLDIEMSPTERLQGLFLERVAHGGNPQDRARPLNHGRTDRDVCTEASLLIFFLVQLKYNYYTTTL